MGNRKGLEERWEILREGGKVETREGLWERWVRMRSEGRDWGIIGE